MIRHRPKLHRRRMYSNPTNGHYLGQQQHHLPRSRCVRKPILRLSYFQEIDVGDLQYRAVVEPNVADLTPCAAPLHGRLIQPRQSRAAQAGMLVSMVSVVESGFFKVTLEINIVILGGTGFFRSPQEYIPIFQRCHGPFTGRSKCFIAKNKFKQ